MYKTFTVGLLGSNTYLVYDEESREAMIVDCGNAPRDPLGVARELSLKIKYIVLTHAHYDHAEFVDEYARLLPDAEVIVHEREVAVMTDPVANVSQFFGTPRSYGYPTRTVKEGDALALGAAEYRVLSTPGHTPGSICLYSRGERLMLTGDTLFRYGYGRTDFKYGSDLDMMASLRRLAAMDGDITILPGHGESALICDAF